MKGGGHSKKVVSFLYVKSRNRAFNQSNVKNTLEDNLRAKSAIFSRVKLSFCLQLLFKPFL